MALNRQQLRERIHLLFCPDNRTANESRPGYWIPPNAEQRREAIEESAIAPWGGGIGEQEWLHEPNPALGGKSPNDLLKSRRKNDLEKLETAIRAIEEGAFS